MRGPSCYGCGFRRAEWRATGWAACEVCRPVIERERGSLAWVRITFWRRLRFWAGERVFILAHHIQGRWWHTPGSFFVPDSPLKPQHQPTYELLNIPGGGTSIKCLRCGLTSYHADDVRERYCGHCRLYHAPRPPAVIVN